MSDADEDPEDKRLDTETQSSNNVQIKPSDSMKSATSSRSSTAELFGGDDTDFLDDFFTEDSVPLKFQRPTQALPENNKDNASPESTETGTDDDVGEEDEESDGDIALPPTSGPEDAPEQSTLPESRDPGEDDHIDSPADEDQNDADKDENEEYTQRGAASEQKAFTEEQVAIVEASSANAEA
ncbi:hypothetical protein DPSP01_009421 [Paraphaeosphaeria sporulosa]